MTSMALIPAEPFKQQQFGTAGIEGVNSPRDYQLAWHYLQFWIPSSRTHAPVSRPADRVGLRSA